MAKKVITVSEEDGVVRVDKYLANKFPEYSRASISKLFTLNLVKYKGEPIQPGHKIRPGAEIEYDLGPLQAKPEVIELPIIYEDKDIIVIDKPSGIISHARGRFWQEASVASFIRNRISGMDGERGGIVHRLDRATSGVMICAKNEETLKFLQKQFNDRKVEKRYVACTRNSPKEDKALVIAPIKRNSNDPKRFHVDKDGKQAETYYEIIKKESKGYQLLLIPKTGRTHQLRIHLSYIGCPIIGDPLYGTESAARMMLHAKSLAISMPNGEKKTFTSKVPHVFNEVIV